MVIEIAILITDYRRMATRKEEGGAGRKRTRDKSERVFFRIPKGDFDYLRHLAEEKNWIGTNVNDAARSIVMREVDAMRKVDYHNKAFPKSG